MQLCVEVGGPEGLRVCVVVYFDLMKFLWRIRSGQSVGARRHSVSFSFAPKTQATHLIRFFGGKPGVMGSFPWVDNVV